MNIAVILAGCGQLDGSEIHESVLTLLSIKQQNANYQCFSLNSAQEHVSDHLSRTNVSNESRNMLVESARIARGYIKPLEAIDINQFNALIIPGGNGIAYNLFDYASKGENFSVNPVIRDTCIAFTKVKKPVGFICIAPVMIPKIYPNKITMTIGTDHETTNLVTKLGAIHQNCNVDEICVDTAYKIISTPAYMLAKDIQEAYIGISKLVAKVVELA